jgi:hypothetical protein
MGKEVEMLWKTMSDNLMIAPGGLDADIKHKYEKLGKKKTVL